MPVTRSAKKKLKQDVRRQKYNDIVKRSTFSSIKKFRKTPSQKLLNKTYSLLDRAMKKNIFHKNKVARLKSGLAKLIKQKTKNK